MSFDPDDEGDPEESGVHLDPREMVRLAEQLIQESHHYLDAPAAILRWAAALDPSEQTLALLAGVLTKLGQHDEAKELLDRLPPSEDPELLNARALARSGCFDHDGAAETLGEAIARAPDDHRFWSNRGLVRYLAGDYEGAADDLVRGLVLNRFSTFSSLNDGEDTPGMADFRALFHASKRIRAEAGPKHAVAFALMDAWARLVSGKIARARGVLRRLPPREQRSWRKLALEAAIFGAVSHRIGSRQRSRDRRKELLAEALEAKPADVALLIAVDDARNYEERSVVELELVLRQTPRWVDGWVQLSGGKREYPPIDLAGALECADRAIELDPDSWGALEARARVLEKLHEHQRALADYDHLIDLYGLDDHEDDEGLDEFDQQEQRAAANEKLCDRALVKYRLRDLDGAARDYDLAAEQAGQRDFQPFVERAKFHAYRRRFDDALADVNEAAARIQQIGSSVRRRERRDDDVQHPPLAESWPWFLRLRASVRARAGDPEGARADRERIATMMREQKKREERAERAEARQKERAAARRKKGKGGAGA